jgi:hypothetical protein
MTCEDAKRRRDAYLAQLRETGRLPSAVPEGASETSLGQWSDWELAKLSTKGAAGSLVLGVEPDGQVKWAISGAFESVEPFDGRHLGVNVVVPSEKGRTSWSVIDLVTRDMTIDARLQGYGHLPQPDLLTALPSEPAQNPGGSQEEWARTALPAAAKVVAMPTADASVYDVDAGVFRSWTMAEGEWEAMERSRPDVIPLGRGAFVVGFRDGGKCFGRYFDGQSKDPRAICDAHRTKDGARFVAKAAGGSEIVDVDREGHAVSVAKVAAPPGSIELIATAPDQVAYEIAKQITVRELAAADRPKPRAITFADTLRCRGGSYVEGACLIGQARLLGTGAVLVEVRAVTGTRLHIAGSGLWRDTPMLSMEGRKGAEICAVDDVQYGDTVTALVHCPGDNPEWHRRHIARDGTMSDSLPATFDVDRANNNGHVRVRGELCAADGFIYQGPACEALRQARRTKK